MNRSDDDDEECTRIAVCVFIGHDPRSWLVEAHELGAECEEEASALAARERAAPGPRVVVTVRRYTRLCGSARRSQWRIGSHVIVESEDFNAIPSRRA